MRAILTLHLLSSLVGFGVLSMPLAEAVKRDAMAPAVAVRSIPLEKRDGEGGYWGYKEKRDNEGGMPGGYKEKRDFEGGMPGGYKEKRGGEGGYWGYKEKRDGEGGYWGYKEKRDSGAHQGGYKEKRSNNGGINWGY